MKHTCKTYFSVNFNVDTKLNATLLRECRNPTLQQLGIFNKDEVEQFIVDNFHVTPGFCRHRFVLGYNEDYNVDVNEMLRVTLKDLLGKEQAIATLQQRFSVTTVLTIVPSIVADSAEPHQILSLNKDILDFLSKSGTAMDLDYYVV